MSEAAEKLRSRISTLEDVLEDLKNQLANAEGSDSATINGETNERTEDHDRFQHGSTEHSQNHFELDEYRRYGRQLIVPEFGMAGQIRLKSTSVLIVGLGGLGCPAAAYLAGAGVGTMGLLDGDTVELSNLHRQILHSTDGIGQKKVDSAFDHLTKLNPTVTYRRYHDHLTPSTAVEIFQQYNIILDCTDRPATRYLISDAAVLSNSILISASALGTDGQLLVLNNPPCMRTENEPGFCYRCVFPKPPPAESVKTCGEGGILGPVVGTMGVQMAMKIIEVVVAAKEGNPDRKPSMLLYSAFSDTPFRTIRLKGKRTDCVACSNTATLTPESLMSGSMDYEEFCGRRVSPNILAEHERISAKEYQQIRENDSKPHILVDVREEGHSQIWGFENSIDIPFSLLQRDPASGIDILDQKIKTDPGSVDRTPVYFVCRYGNDSQVALQTVKRSQRSEAGVKYEFKADIRGGIRAWREEVDPACPDY